MTGHFPSWVKQKTPSEQVAMKGKQDIDSGGKQNSTYLSFIGIYLGKKKKYKIKHRK